MNPNNPARQALTRAVNRAIAEGAPRYIEQRELRPAEIQVGPFLYKGEYLDWANTDKKGSFQTSPTDTGIARESGRWLDSQQRCEYELAIACRIVYR